MRPALLPKHLQMALLAGACAVPLLARAEAASPLWNEVRQTVDVSVSAGVRHEDNLVVEDLDSVSRESGSAAVGSLDIDLEREIGGGREVGAGYFTEQRRFDQHPEYDLGLHYAYGDLSQRVGKARLSTRLDGSVAYLGGERLLENRQLGLALSGLLNRSVYLRGELAFKQTDLLSAPERDNDDTRASLAGYYFLDGTAHYLSAHYRFNAKRAQQFSFDYDGYRFGLLYNRRLSSWATLKLDWRYEERHYLSTGSLSTGSTPDGGTRLDERHRGRARLDIPLGERVVLELLYEHRDYTSNLASVDYTDNRLEARFTLQLL